MLASFSSFYNIPLFYTKIFFPFLTFLFIIFIITFSISYFFPLFKFNTKNYTKLLIIFCFIKFLFSNTSFFSWPQVVDQTLALKILNPSILTNDYLMYYEIQSVRYFFAKFLTLFSYLGIPIEYISQYLLILGKLTMIPLLFLLIINLIQLYLPDKKNIQAFELTKLLLFMLLVGEIFFNFLLYFPTLGWPQFYSVNIAYISGMSIYLSMFYLTFSCLNLRFLSLIFLFFSSLFQITHGTIFVGLYLLFVFPKKKDFVHGFFSLLILSSIVIIYINTYVVANPITAKEFVDIFAFLRHPHHMIISSIFTNFQFFILLSFGISILILIKLNQKKLAYLLTFYIILCCTCVIVQYFVTEVYPIKFLATLTINRFTQTTMCMLMFAYCCCFYYLFQNYSKLLPLQKEFKLNLNKINLDLFLKLLNVVIILIFFFSYSFSKKISTVQIADLSDSSLNKLIQNIKNHSSQDDIFFVMDFDKKNVLSYYIRFFAQRPIYFDNSISMHEDGVLEYKRRYEKVKNIESFNYKHIFHEFKNEFRYLLVPSNSKFNLYKKSPVFVTKTYYCYDIYSFKN